MAIGRPGSVNEIIEMEKEFGVGVNIFAKLKSEQAEMRQKLIDAEVQLERANKRISMLEEELIASEEELAMYEEDER